MRERLLLALLPRRQKSAAGIVCEVICAVFFLCKVFARDGTEVDLREHKTVSQRCAQLLQQIQCERGSSGTQRVQKTDSRIETDRFQRTGDLVAEQGVSKH